MGNATFLVGKMPDKTILSILNSVQETFGIRSAQVQCAGFVLNENDIESLKAKKGVTYLITEAWIDTQADKFRLYIQRNEGDSDRIHYDTVTISHRTYDQPTASEFMDFCSFSREKMEFPRPDLPENLSKTSLGLLEQEIASLKSLHDKMIIDALDLRKTLEEQEALRKTDFEQAALKREMEIADAEKASPERITQEKFELNEKIKEFDLSDHLRARRKLREDISNQVQDILTRPIGSKLSQLKLVYIVSICIISAVTVGFFAYDTLESFITSVKLIDKTSELISPAMLWMLAIRGFILTAVCIGFVAYLVSMLRRSYDEDIHVQRQLQRYSMDINRASWVIETAMEMTTKEGATLPERWVEGATHGLFATGQKVEDPNALTALGAIMGLGPEVNVGPNGASFKLSPKGAKQASKEG